MSLELSSIPLAWIAGMLSILSPCVWPLVPVVGRVECRSIANRRYVCFCCISKLSVDPETIVSLKNRYHQSQGVVEKGDQSVIVRSPFESQFLPGRIAHWLARRRESQFP
jgi:hypothetical protein